jgi:hypothetical protein
MGNLLEKADAIWAAYGKKILIALAVLAVIVGGVYAGQWYAQNKADEFAKSLHEKFQAENQSLYESIATLKAKTQLLEQRYRDQLKAITELKKRQREEVKDVFKSGDTKAIASYFDNVVDGYTPDE